MDRSAPVAIALPQKIYKKPPNLKLVEAKQAAENINRSKRGKFSNDELADFLYLIAEGATYKRIRSFFRKKYNRGISDNTITNYKEQYGGRISEIAVDLERQAIQAGLSKRGQRVTKLQELAEALQNLIFDEGGDIKEGVSSRLIAEYRDTMKLIAQESGDLSTTQADFNFITMDDAALKEMVAGKLAAHKDLAVTLSEAAGVRPSSPEQRENQGANEDEARS